eukprot:TRINITY_DN19242_c0_g1_i1.p1 TRINITY_DN19242_c0_g1~~TRINITY_DN19242_c0_g1_i1.p1  ORF type:complete len:309 (-),score=41.47 TRINITY_DN19242_c0_g1_i1:133-1059(-)
MEQSPASQPPATVTAQVTHFPVSPFQHVASRSPIHAFSGAVSSEGTPQTRRERRKRQRSQEELRLEKVMKEYFPKRRPGRPSREEAEAYQRKLLELGFQIPGPENEQESPQTASPWLNASASMSPSLSQSGTGQKSWESGAGRHPVGGFPALGDGQRVESEGGGLMAGTSMVGRSVHGMVEGAFESGYFITLKVEGEEGDKSFRGVVFGPLAAVQPIPADNKSSASLATQEARPSPPPALSTPSAPLMPATLIGGGVATEGVTADQPSPADVIMTSASVATEKQVQDTPIAMTTPLAAPVEPVTLNEV